MSPDDLKQKWKNLLEKPHAEVAAGVSELITDTGGAFLVVALDPQENGGIHFAMSLHPSDLLEMHGAMTEILGDLERRMPELALTSLVPFSGTKH